MKGKTGVITKFYRTDLVICSHSREGETPFYSRVNTIIQLTDNCSLTVKLIYQEL